MTSEPASPLSPYTSDSGWTALHPVDSLELAKEHLLPKHNTPEFTLPPFTTVHQPYRPLLSESSSSVNSPPVSTYVPAPSSVVPTTLPVCPVCPPPSPAVCVPCTQNPPTPPLQPALQWTQTSTPVTTNNYIQRGNISGNWATYFSGPNYLKVDSMMSQAAPPPVYTSMTSTSIHQRPATPYHYPAVPQAVRHPPPPLLHHHPPGPPPIRPPPRAY